MLDWVSEAFQGAVSFIGESLVKILDWLLSGIVSVLTKAIDAADGVFDVLNSLWNFFVSIKDLLLNLFSEIFFTETDIFIKPSARRVTIFTFLTVSALVGLFPLLLSMLILRVFQPRSFPGAVLTVVRLISVYGRV